MEFDSLFKLGPKTHSLTFSVHLIGQSSRELLQQKEERRSQLWILGVSKCIQNLYQLSKTLCGSQSTESST